MTDATEVRFLSPDEILDADDRPVATLEVEEWGGSIRIRALSLDDYLALKEQHAREEGGEDERALTTAMLQAGIVGEDGEPCFTMEQAGRLLKKNTTAIGRVLKAIGQVTGSTEALTAEAEATFRASAES